MKKRKLIASFLMVLTLFNFIGGFTPTLVHADGSNKLRANYIQLAQGKSLTGLEDIESMDIDSLRAIALYLSNFYVPFSTALDIDEDSEFREEMEKALYIYCGFDREAAEFLVSYALEQNLNTCSQLYIKTEDLKHANDYSKSHGSKGLGFSGVYAKAGTSRVDGVSIDQLAANSSSFYLSNFDKYVKFLGEKTINGTGYVPLTYASFLTVMSEAYHKDAEWSDRYKRHGKSTPVAEFYWLKENSDGSLTPIACYSNSIECLQGYAIVNDRLNYNNGVGSSYSSLKLKELEKLSDTEHMQMTLAPFQKLYVNWVGDIICDDATRRFVIIPGCTNPYALTTISGLKDHVVLTNAYALINSTHIMTTTEHDNDDDNLEVQKRNTYAIEYYAGECSLFNLKNWRISYGSNNYNFDNKFFGLGTGDALKNATITDTGISFTAELGKNRAAFPNFNVVSSVLGDKGETVSINKDNSKNYLFFPKRASGQELSGGTRGLDLIVNVDNMSGYTDGAKLSNYFNVGRSIKLHKTLANGLSTSVTFSNVTEYDKTISYNSSVKSFFNPLFITYCFAYFNKDATKFNVDENLVNMKFNASSFPDGSGQIDFTTLKSSGVLEDIESFVYYLLHPSEGTGYFSKLIKTKVGGMLLSWHDDIVGATDSNSSTGSTHYVGTSGYVTTPSLRDMEWTSKLLDNYNRFLVYLLIIICVILLAFVMVGDLTIQRGVLGFILFAFLAFLPPLAIDTTVNTINTTCDKIFSKKFDYWAVCQMQQYLSTLDDVSETTDVNDYMALGMKLTDSASYESDSANSYQGVKLKWMSPKKYNSVHSIAEAINNSVTTNATFLEGMLFNTINSNISGETFTDSENSLYLYRDYLDIYRHAAVSYNIHTVNQGIPNITSLGNYFKLDKTLKGWTSSTNSLRKIETSSGQLLSNYIVANNKDNESVYPSLSDDIINTSSLYHINKGFLNNTIGDINESNYYKDSTLSTTLFVRYWEAIKDIAKEKMKLSEVKNGETELVINKNTIKNGSSVFGLEPYNFNFGLPELLGYIESGVPTEKSADAYKNLSYLYYSLYSESPMYFFSNNLRDVLVSDSDLDYNYDSKELERSGKGSESGINNNNVIKLFLKDNQGYFFNNSEYAGDGYGYLKDFMNMHDFFYYIVPSLKQGVDVVRDFDKLYNMETFDSCSLHFDSAGQIIYNHKPSKDSDESIPISILDTNGYWIWDAESSEDADWDKLWNCMTEQEQYEFWHDLNVYKIYYMYCSWLDTMMDCEYAEGQNIEVSGHKFYVSDPLDPTSYYTMDKDGNITDGRYMVFSESEMHYYGLDEGDLTNFEAKLIELQENVYQEAIKLTNFYTLSDETLIQAYSTMQLFEFNKIFSQRNLIKEDYTLYPQAYELKAFTYDAYLRLIIAGNTSEDIMENSSGSGSSGESESIYKRVLSKTSIFFALLLVINDILAVYVVSGLKLLFLILIFIVIIFMIICAAIKMQLNLAQNTFKCVLSPLFSYAVISIGFAFIISKFMSEGAQGVVQTDTIVRLGDPTLTIIVMIIINSIVIYLYYKICKKCFLDAVGFGRAIYHHSSSAIAGALEKITHGISGIGSKSGSGQESGIFSSATPEQRGIDNTPRRGSARLGTALGAVGGAIGGAFATKRLLNAKSTEGAEVDNKSDNKYSKKLEEYRKSKEEGLQQGINRAQNKYDSLVERGASDKKIERAKKNLQRTQERRDSYNDKIAERADFRRTITENKHKYGVVYGTVKNVGARYERGVSSAGVAAARVANTVDAGVGTVQRGARAVSGGVGNVRTSVNSLNSEAQIRGVSRKQVIAERAGNKFVNISNSCKKNIKASADRSARIASASYTMTRKAGV